MKKQQMRRSMMTMFAYVFPRLFHAMMAMNSSGVSATGHARGGFHLHAHGGGSKTFKSNRRKQLKVNRRRRMKPGAR